jgi:RNA polymerase sigma-70 factor (ECF subfamily)
MTQQFPPTSLSLLARAQARQEGAWERLVELYGPLVYYWCRQCHLDGEDAADVFQEVFQAVSVHLVEFRRDRPGDTFRGWLRTITRNKARDHFRRAEHQPHAAGGSDAQRHLQAMPDPLLPEDDPSEEDVLARQVRQALEWIRGEFTDQTWKAFWQVQIDNQDTGTVAEALGMTLAAVRKAKYRVLHRLREELKDLMF